VSVRAVKNVDRISKLEDFYVGWPRRDLMLNLLKAFLCVLVRLRVQLRQLVPSVTEYRTYHPPFREVTSSSIIECVMVAG
jgi:hypothetical protein